MLDDEDDLSQEPARRVTVIYAASVSTCASSLTELGIYVGGTSLLHLLLLASALFATWSVRRETWSRCGN